MSEEGTPHEFELSFAVEVAPAVDPDVAEAHAKLVFEMATNFLNHHRLDVRDSSLVQVLPHHLGEEPTIARSSSDMKGVTGKRSPRWAFWTRMTIPCRDGLTYLVRLRIVQTPWFGIYLHDIHEPDGSDPHNHPWSFVSLVLRGHYVERVYPDPANSTLWYLHRRGRLSFHRMGRVDAHSIVEASPGLKTLIFVGKRQGEWGFFENTEYIPWQEYEGREPAQGVGSSVPS